MRIRRHDFQIGHYAHTPVTARSGCGRAGAQHTAGQSAAVVTVLKEDAAVDDGVFDALRFGYETAAAARKIEADFRPLGAGDVIEIENGKVGGHAGLERAAIVDAKKCGRFRSDALDRVLE